jgi:hypothetical protein
LVGKLRGVAAAAAAALDENGGNGAERGENAMDEALPEEAEPGPAVDEDHDDDDAPLLPEDNQARLHQDIVADMIVETMGEPTLFMDGQNHQLKQMFQLIREDLFPGSMLKSGGSCSPFQQTLDFMKGFMNMHQFFKGATFKASLETPDKSKVANSLTEAFEPALTKVAAASRRVFLTYFGELESLVQKTFTPKGIHGAWVGVGVAEFDQEQIFNRCPGWDRAFSAAEKLEIHARMPLVVAEAAPLGYASDESIFKHMGDLIGPPSRGLPGAAPLVGPPVQIAVAEPPDPIPLLLPPIVQQVAQRVQPLLVPRLNPPAKAVSANATSLQHLAFDRWRASFWTKANINAAMAMQAAAQKATDDAKQVVLQGKLAKKQVAADRKRQKAEAAALDLVLGPRLHVARSRTAALACERCMKLMPLVPENAADDWKECDTCNGRWYCPGNDGKCLEQLAEHEEFCKPAAAQAEALHQAALAAAPRAMGGAKRPRNGAAGGGRGRGRGKKA